MKTKVIFAIGILAAFAVGFVAGEFRATSGWAHWNQHNVVQRDATEAFIFSSTLTALRNGHKSSGMSTMENYLDGYLFAISENCKELSMESDAYVYSNIKIARDYRTKYPWQNTNAVIATGVEKALAMVK